MDDMDAKAASAAMASAPSAAPEQGDAPMAPQTVARKSKEAAVAMILEHIAWPVHNGAL